MLAQYHDHTHKQPDGMLFEFRQSNWLFFPESVSKRLKPFHKETAVGLPDLEAYSRRTGLRLSGVLTWATARLPGELGTTHKSHGNGPSGVYHTTGFSRERVRDLCAIIHKETVDEKPTWPPILGLFKSVVATLTYLRRNRVQVELAETYEVSPSTMSRAIAGITPLLSKVLRRYVPTADELDEGTQYIVDGTLLPCWSWASHPELYSGKHRTTGMNVQLACTLTGSLAWISDPIDGCRHDT